jgi:hypothetical protein
MPSQVSGANDKPDKVPTMAITVVLGAMLVVVLLSGGGDSENESAAEPAVDDVSKNIPSAVKPGSKVTGTELFGLDDEVLRPVLLGGFLLYLALLSYMLSGSKKAPATKEAAEPADEEETAAAEDEAPASAGGEEAPAEASGETGKPAPERHVAESTPVRQEDPKPSSPSPPSPPPAQVNPGPPSSTEKIKTPSAKSPANDKSTEKIKTPSVKSPANDKFSQPSSAQKKAQEAAAKRKADKDNMPDFPGMEKPKF